MELYREAASPSAWSVRLIGRSRVGFWQRHSARSRVRRCHSPRRLRPENPRSGARLRTVDRLPPRKRRTYRSGIPIGRSCATGTVPSMSSAVPSPSGRRIEFFPPGFTHSYLPTCHRAYPPYSKRLLRDDRRLSSSSQAYRARGKAPWPKSSVENSACRSSPSTGSSGLLPRSAGGPSSTRGTRRRLSGNGEPRRRAGCPG